jgi:UDP-N-acetylmuramate dehydrogenase
MEFLEDIPGTLGGALIMNAGTYTNNISNLVKRIKYYDLFKMKVIERSTRINDFDKRGSYWGENEFPILSCEIELATESVTDSVYKIYKNKLERLLKQPTEFPNAGSVFVRPKKGEINLPVWQLIDSVGLRGYNINGASFSSKHPGFIVNTDDASYADINLLIKLAQDLIKEKYNIELELEWKII